MYFHTKSLPRNSMMYLCGAKVRDGLVCGRIMLGSIPHYLWYVKRGRKKWSYEVWSVKAVRSEKCKVRTVKCELWSMKFGVRRVQL